MAFMQSLIASSETEVAAAVAPPMPTRICMAADADVIGASVKERATRIAKMARRRCRGWFLQR